MRDFKSIMVVVLTFLLIVSAAGLYIYNEKYTELETSQKELVAVYVASKNIPSGKVIEQSDIKTMAMPKNTITFKSLTTPEIIGKYTKTTIFANEPLREEKLSRGLEKNVSQDGYGSFDKFNMKFSLFQNPNFNAKKGEKIDIIGVWKTSTDPQSNSYAIGYTARGVEILDFLKSGLSQDVAAKKLDAAEKDKPPVSFAEELVLDMKKKDIEETISAYNKNNLLWMVMSNNNKHDEALQEIKKIVNDKPSAVAPRKPAQRATPQPPKQHERQAPFVIYEIDSGAKIK